MARKKTRSFVANDVCPWCATEQDRRSTVKDRKRPQPGDAAICITCGQIAVLGDDDKLRKPTEAEVLDLARDEGVQLVRQAWLRTIGEQRLRH